jgi:phage terminase large subunit
MELRGALAALFTCTDREVLLEGRAGTSKTTGVLRKLIYRAERFPGSRHLVARQTRRSLTESVMVTFDRLVTPGHAAYRDVQRTNRHSNDWPNGSTIVWGGLDNPEGLFSTEWDSVYVPEATETNEDAWEKFGRAMRNNKTDYHQRVADCNPNAPGHWLNQRATKADDMLRDVRTRLDYNRLQNFNHHQRVERMRRLVSVHQDNPSYWDMDLWDWTDLGRQYVMGELASLTGHRRSRLFDGRWRSAEGTVFPEFDEVRHVLSFNVPRDWPIYVFFDPGYDHPCCVLWIAISPNGTYYVIDEIYGGGMQIPDVARAIHEHNAGRTVRGYYGDPQYIFNETQGSPKSIAQQFLEVEHPITFFGWPRTGHNAVSMVEAVRKRLTSQTLKVCANCTNTIGEFQSWSYKRTAKGELPPGDDQFEDRNNHAMDCVKGAVALELAHKYAEIVVSGGEDQARVFEYGLETDPPTPPVAQLVL